MRRFQVVKLTIYKKDFFTDNDIFGTFDKYSDAEYCRRQLMKQDIESTIICERSENRIRITDKLLGYMR